MVKYPGRKGAVYMSLTGTAVATPVNGLSTWSVDQSQDNIEVTVFGDANKTYIPGIKDLKGAFSGFWDDAELKIFSGADSADGVKLYLYPSSDRPLSYHYGPAWISASMETGVNDAIKISANFVANGSWGRVGI